MFEVVGQSDRDAGVMIEELEIGTHVEGTGPCCIDADRAWTHGVLMIAVPQEEARYQWAKDLRPLTEAARQMLALVDHK